MYDVLLTGGQIVDGSGSPGYTGDVAVKDGRIAAVGSVVSGEAAVKLDAAGMCISPGFIDAHTHDDLAVLADPHHAPKLLQGVTTAVLGNCGHGCAPVGLDPEAFRQYSEPVLGRFAGRWDWRRFDDYVERLTAATKTVNTVVQIPHGAVRAAVMGFAARTATPQEIEAMAAIVDEAMQTGAAGLSMGLMYAPGCYADENELIALGRAVARHGGLMNCHLRSEGDALLESMEEFFNVCRRSGASIHVSHLKAISLPNHGRIPAILEWLDDLRRQGEMITCDVYPYPAGSTTILSLLPPWAVEGGVQRIMQRLRDKAVRDRIKSSFAVKWDGMENHLLGTGYERILACGLQQQNNQRFEGKPLSEIARLRGESPEECLLNLIEEEEGRASIILFQMSEEDVQAALNWPWAMIGSDGLPLDSPILHPRHYGTFPRVLGHYVRNKGLMTLEAAIRKMTSLPAAKFRLERRGRLLEGYHADLVMFSPSAITDTATFEQPRNFPQGIGMVMVNGEIVVRSGDLSDSYPGKHLCSGSCNHDI